MSPDKFSQSEIQILEETSLCPGFVPQQLPWEWGFVSVQMTFVYWLLSYGTLSGVACEEHFVAVSMPQVGSWPVSLPVRKQEDWAVFETVSFTMGIGQRNVYGVINLVCA